METRTEAELAEELEAKRKADEEEFCRLIKQSGESESTPTHIPKGVEPLSGYHEGFTIGAGGKATKE